MLATGNSQLAFLAELVHAHRHRLDARHRVPHGRVRRAAADALRRASSATCASASPRSCRSRSSTTCTGDTGDARGGGATATPTLLRAHPLDLCCCGIGENGHLAFNDPPVADFDDPRRREGRRARARVAPPAGRRRATSRRSTTSRRTRSPSRSPRCCARGRRARDRARGAQGRAGARRAVRADHHRVPGVDPAARSRTRRSTSTPSRRRSLARVIERP